MLLSLHTDVASPSPLAGREGTSANRRLAYRRAPKRSAFGPGRGLGRGGAMESSAFAKQLRRNMTDAEHRLWKHLRAHRLDGQKFRRQQPIGPYIVDFVHFGARVVVEADGGQHVQSPHDAARDAWLMRQGLRVLRFWNDDILLHTDAVLDSIWKALREGAPSPPAPLPQGARGARQKSALSGWAHPSARCSDGDGVCMATVRIKAHEPLSPRGRGVGEKGLLPPAPPKNLAQSAAARRPPGKWRPLRPCLGGMSWAPG